MASNNTQSSTSTQQRNQLQRNQLQRQIWKIADEVRGAVDGWDFKQYVLGSLFYLSRPTIL
ncbi:hypothetical protein A9G29_06100 [Gilliamella sp. Fer2-1]|nr:hypothetical protein A9G29_06100 [Gilliamella apicola]